jgi:DNA-binding response OmpR family regulator
MEEEVKVLLIEDDEAAAEMYRMKLVADGYTVMVARDGEAGLELAIRERPDLIYLDLRLPKLDGFEVLERLRANALTATLPVIILSNFGESQLRERGFKLGALEFLVKADTTPASLSERTDRWTAQSEPSIPA